MDILSPRTLVVVFVIAAIALLMLYGCAPPTTPRVTFVPAQYASCPPGAAVPTPPPTPRTTDAIVAWARGMREALIRANAARDDCASRLAGLNAWIADQK